MRLAVAAVLASVFLAALGYSYDQGSVTPTFITAVVERGTSPVKSERCYSGCQL